MRLRIPFLNSVVGAVGAAAIRMWMGGLRWRAHAEDPVIDPTRGDFAGRFIYCFWHECMLFPAHMYAVPGVRVLISRHSDGEFIARIVERLGFGTIRGSTNRQGAAALLEMVRHARRGHVAVTPDGPRGPRRRLQSGIIWLAAKSGLPIVPIGFGADDPWRGTNWDRFQVPRPASFACVIGGSPIRVPADLDDAGMEDARRRVEGELLRVTDDAEAWAGAEARRAWGRPKAGDERLLRVPNSRPPRAAELERLRRQARGG